MEKFLNFIQEKIANPLAKMQSRDILRLYVTDSC